MKKITLFLILILGGLVLIGSSPIKNKEIVDPNNKDIFIKGKITFKNKDIPLVKFWVEGGNGFYSLILFEENSKINSNHLKNISDTINMVFREKICSSSKCYTLDVNGTNYFITDFNNKEIKNKRGVKLFSFGYQVVKQVQNKTNGKVSGHLVVANL